VPKACLDGGREHRENDRWDNGRVVYNCKRDGNYLNIETVGCVGEGSRKLDLGAKTTVGDLVYECKYSGGVPTFRASGCVKDGRQYATGETYEAGQYWYYCMDRDGKVNGDVVGCVHGGQRLSDGDRYRDRDVIYECQVRRNPGAAEVVAVGCASSTIDRRLGCTWVEGQITYTCQADQANKSAAKVATKCEYAVADGGYSIEIGCYKVVGKAGAACVKEGNAGARLVQLTVNDNGQVQSPPAGTRSC